MSGHEHPASRRRFLLLAGIASVSGAAGCLGGPDEDDSDDFEDRPDDWCLDELDETVPDDLRTAESIDGIERDPDDLRPKEEVAYQCHPEGEQLCSNCTFFVPGENHFGACTEVEGEVRTQDWCAIYAAADRLDETPDPNPALRG